MQEHITTISYVVNQVVTSTEHAMNSADPSTVHTLYERIGPLLPNLSSAREDLVYVGSEDDETGPRGRGNLPPIAFQIARETKELVQRLDQIEVESTRDDDDFR